MKAGDVINMIKEKEVRFVDFRFTDTKGKEQHVTMPAHAVDDAPEHRGGRCLPLTVGNMTHRPHSAVSQKPWLPFSS